MKTRDVKTVFLLFALLIALIIPIGFISIRICDACMKAFVLKKERTETVVQDEYGFLDPWELECVREEGKRLQLYNIALYIGKAEEEYTQEQMEEMLESKYRELLPETNSFLLYLLCNDDEVRKCSVKYSIEGNVSKENLSNICEDFFGKYYFRDNWFSYIFNKFVSEIRHAEKNYISFDDPVVVRKQYIEMFKVGIVCDIFFITNYIIFIELRRKSQFL